MVGKFVKRNSVPLIGDLDVKGLQMPVLLKSHHLQKQQQQLLSCTHLPSLFPCQDRHPTWISIPSSSGEEQLTTCALQLSTRSLLCHSSLLPFTRAQLQHMSMWDGAALLRRSKVALTVTADSVAVVIEALAPHRGKMECHCSACRNSLLLQTSFVLWFENLLCLMLSLKEKKEIWVSSTVFLPVEGRCFLSNVSSPWTMGKFPMSGNFLSGNKLPCWCHFCSNQKGEGTDLGKSVLYKDQSMSVVRVGVCMYFFPLINWVFPPSQNIKSECYPQM